MPQRPSGGRFVYSRNDELSRLLENCVAFISACVSALSCAAMGVLVFSPQARRDVTSRTARAVYTQPFLHAAPIIVGNVLRNTDRPAIDAATEKMANSASLRDGIPSQRLVRRVAPELAAVLLCGLVLGAVPAIIPYGINMPFGVTPPVPSLVYCLWGNMLFAAAAAVGTYAVSFAKLRRGTRQGMGYAGAAGILFLLMVVVVNHRMFGQMKTVAKLRSLVLLAIVPLASGAAAWAQTLLQLAAVREHGDDAVSVVERISTYMGFALLFGHVAGYAIGYVLWSVAVLYDPITQYCRLRLAVVRSRESTDPFCLSFRLPFRVRCVTPRPPSLTVLTPLQYGNIVR